ncbi:MAG: hypothetical protein U1E15_09350 [Hyphomicrobiales bacterium]
MLNCSGPLYTAAALSAAPLPDGFGNSAKILKITLSTKDGEDSRDVELPGTGDVTELLNAACRGRIRDLPRHFSVKSLGVSAAVVERILLDREGEAVIPTCC